MSIWNKLFGRSKDSKTEKPVVGKKTTAISSYSSNYLSPWRTRTSNILNTLRLITDESSAVDFVRKNNPDVSMAIWNFVRLANQGNKMYFYDGKNNELVDVENKWREFASRINQISNSGLDGLVDQLHTSAYVSGAMGVEVEVSKDRNDIVDIYPVNPTTISWQLEERNGRETWVPYQQQGLKKVSLEPGKANFFWVPTDPDVNDPRGSLILAPVLQAIDFQMEIMEDLQAVLHHQGYPRNDVEIDLEKMLASTPPSIKKDPAQLSEYLLDQWNNIRDLMQKIDPDDDYLHFSDIKVNMNQGANAQRSLDVRAITDLVDVQTMAGAKQMAIFMNRNQGTTETWGTVQFRIFCSGIESCQRGSKRLMESIARLWLQVNGIQATAKFEHNLVDWNSEEQRMTVQLMKQEFYAVGQMLGWIDKDVAASAIMGVSKATDNPPVYDAINISFGRDGVNSETVDKYKGDLHEPKRNDFVGKELL